MSSSKKDVKAPIPINGHQRIPRVSSEYSLGEISEPPRSYTPGYGENGGREVGGDGGNFGEKYRGGRFKAPRRPSYSTLEGNREQYYNLDYPDDRQLLHRLQLDPDSRFFSRSRPRTLDLPSLLPYKTESPADQAKFLSHIVSHLYIAIKSLDLQGSLSVTASDLAALKEFNGGTDIDLALETNIFELGNTSTSDYEGEEILFNEDYSDSDEDDEDDEDELSGDDGGEDDGETTVQHKKSPKSAAVINVRTWTHELLVWMKMKYDMPVTLRIALAKVYYALALSRGQLLNLKTYVKTFESLTKDAILLKKQGLVLPWKDLCCELENHFPSVDSTIDPIEKKDHKQLLSLASKAAQFFEEGALPKIYSKFGSKLSVSNASLVLSSMTVLPLQFTKENDENDIRYYLSSFFYIWAKLGKNPGIDSQLTSRLGLICMSSLQTINSGNTWLELGDFGIFSRDQMNYLFNTLTNNLSIMVDKYSSMKSKFFHGYASAIVYSINGEISLRADGIIDHLKTLLNAIESYVHPSNSGEWSRPISKLCLSLIYQFHKRVCSEREKDSTLGNLPDSIKITPKIVDRFVSMVLPIIKIGIQSKKASAVDDYLTSLQLVAHLNPSMVLEYMLLDIYESLEGVISTHRVIIALRSIEPLARYFASTKIYRVHLVRILSLALPGIDSNDLEKTLHTLDAFSSVANFVPFVDLTDGLEDEGLAIEFTQSHLEYLQRKIYDQDKSSRFEVDNETELRALKSSTTAFKSLIKALSQRLFILFENIPDPSKTEGIERDLVSSIPKFIYVILESVSDDIYKSFQQDFFEFIFNNTYHTIADVTAEICGGIVKRDPSCFVTYGQRLIDRIREEIDENGAGQTRTGVDILPRDQNLFWNLVILNECIGNAGSQVLTIGDELVQLAFYLLDNVKGPVVFASSYIINQVLQAVTKIRLNENRLISPNYVKQHGIDEKCWGGFQFDPIRFSPEYTDFSWFIPGEAEVKFAVDNFNEVVVRNLRNISKLMREMISQSASDSVHQADDLRTNLLYIGYALSGISWLLDPSFEEDIPKLNHQSESIEKRLLLLKHIRNAKSEDEEDVNENLDRIVGYLSGDYMETEEPLTGEDDTKKSDSPSSSNEDLPKIHNRVIDDLMEHEDVPESTPSPKIDGMGVSEINPSLTFRERKLYTSNYYFGEDIEIRKSNDLYLKLHKTHHLLGRSLHIICRFLTKNFHDNTKLFKHLLYVINVWFSDVGRERILDSSHAKIHYGYISSLQSINKMRKPFTRIAIGSRIEAYHSMRISLHATSRTQTPLDKSLLEDIVKLSLSTYASISSPAQSLLVDIMKRVGSSYSVIVKTAFMLIQKALSSIEKTTRHKETNNVENNQVSESDLLPQMIESGLNIFTFKKIKSKLHSDYYNLQKYIEILHKCQNVDSFEVQMLGQKLLEAIHSNISVPSSICLINHEFVDSIRPPDEFIDLEIKVIKFAKEKKRKVYFEKVRKLEEFLIQNEKLSNHWKTSSSNLNLLINLQTEMETPINPQILELLFKQSTSDHPLISRLALKGITRVILKLYLLQGINYDVAKAFDFGYLFKDFVVVDTRPQDGKSYYETWKTELQNTKNPHYFVDSKATIGWLFWDTHMKMITPDPCYKLDQLSEHDSRVLDTFCTLITKDWILGLVKLWITDNEANFAFQGSDVFFTSTLILLLSNGKITNLTLDDLLSIISEVYIEDDKSCHIVVCELISGILLGSKWLNPEFQARRDEFIGGFLTQIFEHDLSPDNRGIWNIFSWWLPSHIDIRRFPVVIDAIFKFHIDKDSDSIIRQATRISYMKSMLASITWNFANPDHLLDFCMENINHRYEAVRTQIGSLLAVLSFPYYSESVASSTQFLENCNQRKDLVLYHTSNDQFLSLLPGLFDRIEAWRKEVEHKSPQEILRSDYIYSATTVLTWLLQELNTSVGVVFQSFVVDHIVPFLLRLINMKDVCQLGNIDPITVFKSVSQIHYNQTTLAEVVGMLQKYSRGDLNVIQSIILGEFTETLYFKNLFLFTTEQRLAIIGLTNDLLYHKNVEIRESAAVTLSGLIHISHPKEVDQIVQDYIGAYTKDLDGIRKKYRKSGYKAMEQDDIKVTHGAVLGLGALVHAFSFSSPPPKWVPQILATLANKSSGMPGIIGKTSKDTLGKFKKNRQDTWHIDSKVFSESQKQDLEGVLWKSYFI